MNVKQERLGTMFIEGRLILTYPDGAAVHTNFVLENDNEIEEIEAFLATETGQKLCRSLCDVAILDHNTKLLRQQPAREMIEQNLRRLQAVNFTGLVSLIFLDIDHFKSVNNRFGNPGGDSVLRWLAKILQSCVRTGDVIGRWGGEEFVIFAPANRPRPQSGAEQSRISTGTTMMDLNSMLGNGRMIGERIRQNVEDDACLLGFEFVKITVTIGVANAWIEPHAKIDGLFDQLLERANMTMYACKVADKRNSVEVADLIHVT